MTFPAISRGFLCTFFPAVFLAVLVFVTEYLMLLKCNITEGRTLNLIRRMWHLGQYFCIDIKQSVSSSSASHSCFAMANIECCFFNALLGETLAVPLSNSELVEFTVNCLRDLLSSTCDPLADQKSQTPLKDQRVLNQP